MSEIRPFCGLRYNNAIISDLAEVICPPYDVISPAQQRSLYNRNPYNFVRIEYGEVLPKDNEEDNKYRRAASFFKDWLSYGIIVEDAQPAFYIHDHYFTFNGKEHRRRGLVCRVRLEEWSRMVVRPHENTLAAPKGDRIRLLKSLRANTSPVLAMYRDLSGTVTKIMTEVVAGKTIAASSFVDDERHELFTVSDHDKIAALEEVFSPLPLYIADGHHRYESALNYQREKRALHTEDEPTAPYNSVLMTLIDMDDPELLILPPHRLIHGLPAAKLVELEAGLAPFFDISRMTLNAPDAWSAIETLTNQADKLRLVLAGPGNLLRVLNLRDFEATARLIPGQHTDIYKRLDVSLVDHIVLEEVLGIQSNDESIVSFNYDRADTVKMVLDGECQLAFIVKPACPVVIKSIADAQDRMPRKSTYFYPKLPSGLIINRVD